MHRTADTITDDEIRELLRYARDVAHDPDLTMTAQIALGEWRGSHRWEASSTDHTPCCVFVREDGSLCGAHPWDADAPHIYAARFRCAEALNLRSKN